MTNRGIWDEGNLTYLEEGLPEFNLFGNNSVRKYVRGGGDPSNLGFHATPEQVASLRTDDWGNWGEEVWGTAKDAFNTAKGWDWGTIFDGVTALGSLYTGYQSAQEAKERNRLLGEDLAHRKAMDLENLANLRVTTGNELQRAAFNAQQLGANLPVMGLPDSNLVSNTPTVDLNKLNVA